MNCAASLFCRWSTKRPGVATRMCGVVLLIFLISESMLVPPTTHCRLTAKTHIHDAVMQVLIDACHSRMQTACKPCGTRRRHSL